MNLPTAWLDSIDVGTEHPLASLRALVQRERTVATHERCDLCAVTIGSEHRHVVDVEERTLRCLCGACALLFSDSGAGRGRYRPVGQHYRSLPGVLLTQENWEELQIPVGLAFFFTSSSVARTVAFYPGPAGATESLLPLEQWEKLAAAHPELTAMVPDVEAVLIRRQGEQVACYLVPIDACYELVGHLRRSWVGFDGGAEARSELERFFKRIEERAGA